MNARALGMNERTASRDVQVVLVAGEHEQHTLVQVEVALRMHGMPTAVIDARSDAAIIDALARLGDHGLVVLVRGESLSGARIDAVRHLLAASDLPVSRTLTLGVDDGARALETRVLATVRRLAASGPPRHSTVPPVHSGFVGHARHEFRVAEADSMPTPPPAHAPVLEAHESDSSVHTPSVRRRRPRVLVASAAAIAAVVLGVAVLRSLEPAAVPDDLVADATPHVPEGTSAQPTVPDTAKPEPTVPRADALAAAVEIGEAPAVPTATPAVEDAPEVVAALRKRDVRALDLVVISPEATKAADFAGASAYCDALVIGELDGWRLPEIGELLSMSRAKMVRRGSFWSATKGDAFGDLRLVLVIKRERISPIPSGWNGGRVVCVRERA